MDTLDIALRLGAATLVGIVLGLNRDLHARLATATTTTPPPFIAARSKADLPFEGAEVLKLCSNIVHDSDV